MPGLPGRAARTGYRVLRRLEEDDSLDRHAGNEDRRDHPPPWRLREADGQRRQARARRVQRKGGSFPGEQDDDDHGDRRREKLYPRMPAAPERLAQKADRDVVSAGKPDREKTRHDHGEGVYDHVRRSGNRSAERGAHDDVGHHQQRRHDDAGCARRTSELGSPAHALVSHARLRRARRPYSRGLRSATGSDVGKQFLERCHLGRALGGALQPLVIERLECFEALAALGAGKSDDGSIRILPGGSLDTCRLSVEDRAHAQGELLSAELFQGLLCLCGQPPLPLLLHLLY